MTSLNICKEEICFNLKVNSQVSVKNFSCFRVIHYNNFLHISNIDITKNPLRMYFFFYFLFGKFTLTSPLFIVYIFSPKLLFIVFFVYLSYFLCYVFFSLSLRFIAYKLAPLSCILQYIFFHLY